MGGVTRTDGEKADWAGQTSRRQPSKDRKDLPPLLCKVRSDNCRPIVQGRLCGVPTLWVTVDRHLSHRPRDVNSLVASLVGRGLMREMRSIKITGSP